MPLATDRDYRMSSRDRRLKQTGQQEVLIRLAWLTRHTLHLGFSRPSILRVCNAYIATAMRGPLTHITVLTAIQSCDVILRTGRPATCALQRAKESQYNFNFASASQTAYLALVESRCLGRQTTASLDSALRSKMMPAFAHYYAAPAAPIF